MIMSTLVQVMAWCRQATSHYPSQCWPRSLSPYGVTRPEWVKKPNFDRKEHICSEHKSWKEERIRNTWLCKPILDSMVTNSTDRLALVSFLLWTSLCQLKGIACWLQILCWHKNYRKIYMLTFFCNKENHFHYSVNLFMHLWSKGHLMGVFTQHALCWTMIQSFYGHK